MPDAPVDAPFELSTQASTANPAINTAAVGPSQGINAGPISNLTLPQTNLIGRFNIPESEWSKPSERERKAHRILPRRQSRHPSSTARPSQKITEHWYV